MSKMKDLNNYFVPSFMYWFIFICLLKLCNNQNIQYIRTFFKIRFYCCVSTYMNECMPPACRCLLRSEEGISWLGTRWLWHGVRPPGRIGITLNCWAISLSPRLLFLLWYFAVLTSHCRQWQNWVVCVWKDLWL